MCVCVCVRACVCVGGGVCVCVFMCVCSRYIICEKTKSCIVFFVSRCDSSGKKHREPIFHGELSNVSPISKSL